MASGLEWHGKLSNVFAGPDRVAGGGGGRGGQTKGWILAKLIDRSRVDVMGQTSTRRGGGCRVVLRIVTSTTIATLTADHSTSTTTSKRSLPLAAILDTPLTLLVDYIYRVKMDYLPQSVVHWLEGPIVSSIQCMRRALNHPGLESPAPLGIVHPDLPRRVDRENVIMLAANARV